MSKAPAECVRRVRAKLGRLEVNGVVPLGAAQRLTRDCAYWYGHPNGPARAPEHSKRLVIGPFGWELEFGANYFLVGSAISGSVALIREYTDLAEGGHPDVRYSDIAEELRMTVLKSVANSHHERYNRYADHDGFMLFGTQAIHVPSFVNMILTFSEARSLCSR